MKTFIDNPKMQRIMDFEFIPAATPCMDLQYRAKSRSIASGFAEVFNIYNIEYTIASACTMRSCIHAYA